MWSIEFVHEKAEKEVKDLPADLQAKFLHITELLLEFGPKNVGMPHTRPLGDKLWEIRLKGKDNIARSIYFLASQKCIVILHTFIKKTQKTPKYELDIAKQRLKEKFHEEI